MEMLFLYCFNINITVIKEEERLSQLKTKRKRKKTLQGSILFSYSPPLADHCRKIIVLSFKIS